MCAETGCQMLYQAQDGVSGHRQPKKSVKASKMLLDSSDTLIFTITTPPSNLKKETPPKIEVLFYSECRLIAFSFFSIRNT